MIRNKNQSRSNESSNVDFREMRFVVDCYFIHREQVMTTGIM